MRLKLAAFPCLLLLTAGVYAGAAAPALVNGSMTDGEAAPTAWGKPWTPKGKGTLRVVRDTTVFVKGPASLRLEAVGGSADGNTSQTVADLTGRK